MAHTAIELSYPVRWAVIAKYFGQLCLVISALTVVPAVVALLSTEMSAAVAFFAVALVLAAIGLKASRITAATKIQTNEGLVISCATFLIIAITMTVPFMAFGLSLSDAFFESTSAVTTTGLSTLAGVEARSTAFLFARAWMQWYGGLGIAIFSVALITRSGGAAKSLMIADTSDAGTRVGVQLHARRVLISYCIVTLVGCGLIALTGVGLTNAVMYSLAAVSTGGFAPHDDSLRGLGSWLAQVVVTLVCFGSALPFYLYYRSFREGWKTFFRDQQLRALLVTSSAVSLVLSLCLLADSSRSTLENLIGGILLAISAQTTTGFESLEVASLGNTAKLLLLCPMFVGGGMGSSAGGLKLVRFLILVQLIRTAVAKASQPRHAVIKAHLFGHPLSQKETEEASMLLLAYLVLVVISWLPFVMFGYDPLNSLFEVVSAGGTVGLSTGVTSGQLPVALKLVLSADMLMGRLEVYAWLVVFSRRTWFGNQVQQS